MLKHVVLCLVIVCAFCAFHCFECGALEDADLSSSENYYADDVPLDDDKEEDLFNDFENIIEDDLEALFEDAVTDEDFEAPVMVPRFLPEELGEDTLSDEMTKVKESVDEMKINS